MDNPLLVSSTLPFGAPRFDLIRQEHYLPAFRAAIEAGKAEVDAIAANPEAPTFANTVEALEFAGADLDRVSGIFFNLLEAESDDRMQEIAEEVSPLLTDFDMYVSLNEALFARVKAVYDGRSALDLAPDQRKLLEESYKDFVRSGALLGPEDKKTLEDAIEKAKKDIETDDVDKIKTAMDEYSKVSNPIIAKLYENMGSPDPAGTEQTNNGEPDDIK